LLLPIRDSHGSIRHKLIGTQLRTTSQMTGLFDGYATRSSRRKLSGQAGLELRAPIVGFVGQQSREARMIKSPMQVGDARNCSDGGSDAAPPVHSILGPPAAGRGGTLPSARNLSAPKHPRPAPAKPRTRGRPTRQGRPKKTVQQPRTDRGI